MRWVSGLTARQRLRIIPPWLAPWMLLNVLWLSWLEFHFYSPLLNRIFGLTQFLLVGGILSLAWHERQFRRPALSSQRCPKCGYDLRATPNRCPECGTKLGNSE